MARPMTSFRVDFLGCKVNQVEAEDLRDRLFALGLREAASGTAVDLYVLNTCSVTAHAGATSRKWLRRALRENPGAAVIATGCYAESDRARLARMPGIRAVFGNEEKDAIAPFVARELLGGDQVLPRGAAARPRGRARAFVKVEDGCDDACTFCIIPRLRGPARSRDEAEILGEVRELVGRGHREIVLTGIHLGYYGRGTGERGLALLRLLEQVAETEGLGRLRLSSLEVQELTPPLLAFLSSHPRMVPHFHLPLQSGSDRVLRRMRRKYNATGFAERVAALREAVDRPALTTDVLPGFPGEEEADFESTVELCRKLGFAALHVFPYSARPGTAAASYPQSLSAAGLARRKRILLDLGEALAASWRDRFLGSRGEVLVEGPDPARAGHLVGLTERNLRVSFPGRDRLRGEILPVQLDRALPGAAMLGRLAVRVGAGP
jgi:threonylcarbamoyladenosine tRNA methylthiotransferase MtaB